MSRHVIAALSLATHLSTTAAFAVTVKNLDGTEHKVTVAEGSSTLDLSIKPGESLTGICLKGCLLRLNGNTEDPYELEGMEVTTIEKGQLWGEDQEPPVPEIDGEPDGASSSSPPP
ncbi:MAG: hypothetical protein ABL894_08135 [Hyphomicrobium sp.]